MAKTRRALAVAVTTAFRADPWRSAGVLILSSLASIGAVLGAYWLRKIVDSVAAHNQAGALSGPSAWA